VSWQLDAAIQVLVISGFYGLWCVFDEVQRSKPNPQASPKPAVPIKPSPEFTAPGSTDLWPSSLALRAMLRLAAGWTLGLLLAAPAILPVVEYAQSGARMARRAHGEEERPPGNLSALPQIVLPDLYGRGLQPGRGIQLESPAAAYAGALMTLFAAPLAWTNRRRRSMNIFWISLVVFSLSWCLGIPGMVHLLRLHAFNMVSHNRWVFAASLAIIAMAAMGLDELFHQRVRWQWWYGLPAACLGALCVWSAVRAAMPPEPYATQLDLAISQGKPIHWEHTLQDVQNLKSSFQRYSVAAAVWCGLGLIGWLFLWLRTGSGARSLVRSNSRTLAGPAGSAPPSASALLRNKVRAPEQAWAVIAVAALLTGELLWSAYGRCAQSDPALYYPPIPALQQVAQSVPGRIIGHYCLPANLATICGLLDIRGDDGVDPARLLDLSRFVTDQPAGGSYALMQWLPPKVSITPNGDLRFSPILDMFGVRYMIFRGAVPAKTKPLFQSADYAVFLNPSAMDRVFVPKRVEVVSDSSARLQKLGSIDFNPREVAYVESAVNFTTVCQGRATIVKEIPTDIVVSAKMETDGLLVLADSWDKGWHAYLDGKLVPILRANHAIRGVVVPKGNRTVEFKYQPASFAWGLRFAVGAALALFGWLIYLWRVEQGNRA